MNRRRKQPESEARRKKKGRFKRIQKQKIQPKIVSSSCSSSSHRQLRRKDCPTSMEGLAAADGDTSVAAETLMGMSANSSDPQEQQIIQQEPYRRWSDCEKDLLVTYFDHPAKVRDYFRDKSNFCRRTAAQMQKRLKYSYCIRIWILCDAVSDNMIAYRQLYQNMEAKFEGCELKHIGRANNEEADTLANIGSMCSPILDGVFYEVITQRSIKEKASAPPKPSADESEANPQQAVEESPPRSTEQVLLLEPLWTKPFLTYLTKQELP